MKKRFILIFMIFIILLNTSYTYAENVQLQGPIDENPAVEIPPEEIRNQNFLVPTSNGVQKGNLKEKNIIDNLESKSLEQLTKAYLLGDAETGEIVEGHNIDQVLPLASTSKLVAIYVVLDKIKDGSISLDDKVLIDHESSVMVGSSYKLKENDELTVGELLESAMVISANDSITSLGKFIAGTNESFVAMMQEKCNKLGLKNAHMVNCTGLTNYLIEDYNKMTTRELFQLTSSLIKEYPQVITMAKIPFLKQDERNLISYNTNPILGIVPEIDGLKTGYTNAAGRCLISTGLKTGIPEVSKDLRLIGITMGSSGDWARFVASKRLMTQGFESYSNKILASTEKPVGKLEIPNAVPAEVDVFPLKSSAILYNEKKNLTSDVKLNPPSLPISPGTSVGTVTYYLDGVLVYSTDVVTKEKVKDENIIYKFQKLYKEIFENIEKAA